ncbi:glycerophosphodiester phosphodiesterase family protein [Vibrio penaeicida]|uniref:glycerophosphodiester phosphodiesterase n=1 Tax=Vibrio penaeicida TaxID=104609 RepID=A0AAV5NN80_9VIBR|nr:glycerophosphodiester phosphodiesterase family protein [Vibrio penaeicida]RTZ23165.1 glycerophosphodiester phosphodiesterase [Vibrio penaeicida]GLQ72090.1 glycerophosphoryl diester phosphodiesterase [Vibrio penaeicida]
MKSLLKAITAVVLLGSSVNAIAHETVQLGPRPFYLIEDMDNGSLKRKLQNCSSGSFYRSDFSIGHRGAPMQFPEHTKESYLAAIQMGAGILECDVTFTKDKELVCRHSQSDLHTTTDVLAHSDLAAKCTVPFQPANPTTGEKAKAECRTSDFTLSEFKRLKGKMDGTNAMAPTVEEYMNGTAGWRTDLYSSKGTLLTHAESIALFKKHGVKMTPELKAPAVEMPFNGFTQEMYAEKLVSEYRSANVPASDVFAQSFNLEDVKYWIQNNSEFGKQAVYLDDRVYNDENFKPTLQGMKDLVDSGVKIIAPPMYALVTLDASGKIVPSEYTKLAKKAGLDIITWTLERSGPLGNGGGWYYQSIKDATNNDGDTMVLLDVLAKEVGVLGVFSDWPATTTYYANCMNM